MKIRGTPSHIAEKYVAMARDALSSGDPVLAENYLQHAEHYNRIIMAYREQQAALAEQNQSRQPRQGEDVQGEDNGEGDEAAQPSPQATRSSEGQGRWNGNGNGNGSAGGERDRSQAGGQPAAYARDGERRPPASEDDTGERRQRGPRGRRPGRGERSQRDTVEGSDQPDFLTRPIRRSRRDETAEPDAGGEVEAVTTDTTE